MATKRDWWTRDFRVMFTFGQSITAGGWSSCRDRCWANHLARMISDFQRIPVHLVNMGIGANLISTKSPNYALSGKPAADERLEKHILDFHANGNLLPPDLLVIAYGSNDARGGTPLELFITELTNIIRRVRERIAPLIVLLGPYHMVDWRLGAPDWNHATPEIIAQYHEAIKAAAAAQECLFVDLLAAYGGADWMVHHDGVHANDLGHRVIANRIFEVLAQNCSALARQTKELEKEIAPWRDEATLQA